MYQSARQELLTLRDLDVYKRQALTWPLFGALHGHLSGMLLSTYPDAILSLNLFPNKPTDA